MPRKPSVRPLLLCLLALGLCLPGVAARAQSRGYAAIVAPDFSKFPSVTTLLDAFDDQGQFVAGLAPSNVTILENGQQTPAQSVDELQPPLSVVVAINSSPILATRDSLGVSRYDKMAAVISNWAGARPGDSHDDISLAWNGGIVASHLTPSDWRNHFDVFDPALRSSKSGLAALSYALDAAQDAQTIPGQKKVILLLSGHLDNASVGGLKDLITRAQGAGVRVYVWLSDSQDFLINPGSQALQGLADATGGRYLTFTGLETLPDPEEWFSPLRHIYQVSYSSRIHTSGPQSISMEVVSKGLALTTPSVSFQVNIQPPNPALLAPPEQIVRQNPTSPFDTAGFQPKQQQITALIEFPDGHPRPLTRTALYVDGQKVSENTSEPFDKFNWDLSGYTASGQHMLAVEAQDQLGLSNRSAPVPVTVTVVLPPGGVFGLLLRNSATVTISLVVLAGAVVLGIIFLGGRLGLPNLVERRRARAAKNDPVTQPVPMGMEKPGAPPHATAFPWLRRKSVPPQAYLVRLTPDGQPSSGDPIGLTGQEMTFGTDPTQATFILDHPSISPLHARLRINAGSDYQLIDQNSVAGTWVNYVAIPKEGCTLRHGDVVNFGQLIYRFVLNRPPAPIKPTITPR